MRSVELCAKLSIMQLAITKPKKESANFSVGDIVRVFHAVKEKDSKRTQIFEGIVISRHARIEPGASFTVRKITDGIGIEKNFPLFSPLIEKIEVLRQSKVRRAKLYYVRNTIGKQAKLKEKK